MLSRKTIERSESATEAVSKSLAKLTARPGTAFLAKRFWRLERPERL